VEPRSETFSGQRTGTTEPLATRKNQRASQGCKFEAPTAAGQAGFHQADTARFYPFFWGYAHERGRGQYNLNLPLERGSDDEVFLATL
jgi:acetoin utilization deacetylase AcuC-like enzyme